MIKKLVLYTGIILLITCLLAFYFNIFTITVGLPSIVYCYIKIFKLIELDGYTLNHPKKQVEFCPRCHSCDTEILTNSSGAEILHCKECEKTFIKNIY